MKKVEAWIVHIKIQQNTTTYKIVWPIPLFLENPKKKDFQPSELQIDFLIDSGAESNIINIPHGMN